jgi:hypothetical protein
VSKSARPALRGDRSPTACVEAFVRAFAPQHQRALSEGETTAMRRYAGMATPTLRRGARRSRHAQASPLSAEPSLEGGALARIARRSPRACSCSSGGADAALLDAADAGG